jgi:hypothetical protein
MAKIAVVVLSGQDNPGRARAGLHVAKRMYDARQENGIDAVEVFLFTQGVRLVAEPETELGALVHEVIEAGIGVGGCSNQLNDWGLASAAEQLGVQAEFARDAFSRYAREGYTVMTF